MPESFRPKKESEKYLVQPPHLYEKTEATQSEGDLELKPMFLT